MLAGLPYRVDQSLLAEHLRAQELLERYNCLPADQPDVRSTLLGELLGSCGPRVTIKPRLACDYGWNIHIEHDTFINYDAVLLDVAQIRIGPFCQFGPRVQILTATHPLEPLPREQGWESGVSVRIGRNVWLGAGVIVCPGVEIGDDTVVGAGSVVTRDLPGSVVAVGSPARAVREVPGKR